MADKPVPEKPGKFDTGLVRELAAILREADLGEIEVEQGEMRIRVSKAEAAAVHLTAPSYAPTAAAAFQSSTPPAASATSGGPDGRSVEAAAHPGLVKSPMVGTVYLSAEAGAAQFAKPGDMVKEGQTLLLVEAMKTFNPVLAPRAGKLLELLVSNEQPVEYGEPLAIIE
ncbi:MAG: acetyl-CoA carboxylase biotin carboxyl carrier protein subunit [Alphaproteobacteria bacterium]|nr:acetyl-CoA carboxylase biotin carboxyl carrier protein subunit [Alphaproteobacteria bacterium]